MLGRYFSQVTFYSGWPEGLVRKTILRIFLIAKIFVLAGMSSPAFALGVGAAEADSFIGEQLSVRIPLFNVANPNSLQIEFNSDQFDGDNQANVTAVLDRTNSQLAITLSSDKIVNEPYLSFALSLLDDNAEFAKDFSVLLNLPPQNRVNRPQSQTSALDISNNQSSSSTGSSIPGSIMGPYDTAIAGNIPERFGAVLDGQSLWRVARRINTAMSVSRNQMMWALYQANPDAFATENIESLRAGAYLTIPSEQSVAQLSDSQAKAKLQALSRVESSRSLDASKSGDNAGLSADTISSQASGDQNDISELTKPLATNEPGLNQGPFQITSIDQPAGSQPAQGDSDAANSGLSQAQMIIASLTETVGNMSQRLERKDQKIEFLEGQVEELKSFIEAEDLPVSDELSQNLAQTPLIKSSEIDSSIQSVSENNKDTDSKTIKGWLKSIWPWVLLSLLILVFVIYALWERIQNLVYSLNLSAPKDNMEFSVAEPQMDLSVIRQTEDVPYRIPAVADSSAFDLDEFFDEGSISVHNDESHDDESQFHEEESICFDGSFDEPVSVNIESGVVPPNFNSANTIEFGAQEHSNSHAEPVSDVKPLQLESAFETAHDETEMGATIELLSDEISIRKKDEEVTFEQRFDRLLQEKDYDFALELLDFARHNEINDERYHFERLRMLEAVGDENDFYEYYYSIEDKISDFRQDTQTGISQLVVKMAHE